MKSKQRVDSPDPDIRGSWTALKRAARKARQLSIEAGTPFYVKRGGRIIDLNRTTKLRKKRRAGSGL